MFPPPVGNVAPIGSHVPTYTGLTLENNAQTPSPHRGCFLRKNLPLYIPFIPHVIGVVPSASVGVHFPIGGAPIEEGHNFVPRKKGVSRPVEWAIHPHSMFP